MKQADLLEALALSSRTPAEAIEIDGFLLGFFRTFVPSH